MTVDRLCHAPDWRPGMIIHGFCWGSFGRDSYECRVVEHVGRDYIVTRNESARPELATGRYVPTVEEAGDRSYCDENCTGPSWVRTD